MSALEQLSSILEQLEQAPDDETTRTEAIALMQSLGNEQLVALEDRLVAAGLPVTALRPLCSAHMQASAGDRGAFRASLPHGHPLATLMDEHQHILERLDRLEALATPEDPGADATARRERWSGMAELGAALVAAEPHHAREEQVLFPALREVGVDGPPAVMEAEHMEIRALKHAVEDVARSLLEGAGDWSHLRSTALRVVAQLRDHIFKEDHILYPMAARFLTDPAAWDELRRRCDAIGYCCHAPEPAAEAHACPHH